MKSIALAKKIRETSLEMVYTAKASHIGGALSMADILAVLYANQLNYNPNDPNDPKRDRFILSKGHSCVALYATLAHCNFFDIEELKSYGNDGSRFLSHTTHKVEGIEFSAGSLGHGLPIATGLALASKRKNENWNSYVLVGDGEMDEGSNWEAMLLAAQYNLDNLCLIIDYNKIQSMGNTNDIISLDPLQSKFEAFNWAVVEIDGHDHQQLNNAIETFKQNKTKPTVIIAHTIKGKGVSFMENEVLWHYKSPDKNQLLQSLKEIEL